MRRRMTPRGLPARAAASSPRPSIAFAAMAPIWTQPARRAGARQSAAAKNLAGWRFTLQGPSYLALMTYLDDGALREQVYRAHSTRATAGKLDNREIIAHVLALRR